jgi:hypothetical protein
MKKYFKNTKNSYLAAVLVLTIAITTTAVLAATTTTATSSLSSFFPITSSIAIPTASATPATTTGNAANTTSTTTTTTSQQPELSPQPFYEERSSPGAITPINETHGIYTYSGNGMLTLPNTTQTINTTHNGTVVTSFTTLSGHGKETIRTEDGETATATVFEIVQLKNPAALSGEGKGIVTAVFQTNSTGVLAPLNGTIAVGVDEFSLTQESHITFWKWESGIPLPPPMTTTSQEPSMMNTTTTTMTNATTTTNAANTNATTAEGEETTTTPEEPLDILGQ